MAPPLDVDLNTMKTDMPLLADGIYDLQFSKVELKKSKAMQDMFSLDLVTTSPAKTNTGEDLGQGVHVFDNLNLAPSGKATWEMVARNIGAVVQSTGVTIPGANFAEQLENLRVNGVAMLQGQIARCKVGFVPEGPDKTGVMRKAKNQITVWMKRGS